MKWLKTRDLINWIHPKCYTQGNTHRNTSQLNFWKLKTKVSENTQKEKDMFLIWESQFTVNSVSHLKPWKPSTQRKNLSSDIYVCVYLYLYIYTVYLLNNIYYMDKEMATLQ